MKKLLNKLHPSFQGVLFGCLISFLILVAIPPIVIALRWWFKVWGV